jgi:Domain of unknown function (DUF1917)
MMSGDNRSYTIASESKEGGEHGAKRARCTDDGCSAESAIYVDDESFNGNSEGESDCLVEEPVATRLVRTHYRIQWPVNDTSSESRDEWLANVRPSLLSQQDCAWIQVHNAIPSSPGFATNAFSRFDDRPYNELLDKLRIDLRSTVIRGVKAGMRTVCLRSLVDIATRQRCTVGKWLLYFTESNVDASWEQIARATADGRLGSSSKVCPMKNRPNPKLPPVCCVYVEDFTCQSDVKRVLLELEDMGFKPNGFKPDFFTYINIYQKNEWGIPPTLFSAQDVKDW